MQNALGRLAGREREILMRFYLEERTKEQICEEMDLTLTQFRLLKWRAKARISQVVASGLTRDGLVHPPKGRPRGQGCGCAPGRLLELRTPSASQHYDYEWTRNVFASSRLHSASV